MGKGIIDCLACFESGEGIEICDGVVGSEGEEEAEDEEDVEANEPVEEVCVCANRGARGNAQESISGALSSFEASRMCIPAEFMPKDVGSCESVI